jgi:hypothetical protein
MLLYKDAKKIIRSNYLKEILKIVMSDKEPEFNIYIDFFEHFCKFSNNLENNEKKEFLLNYDSFLKNFLKLGINIGSDYYHILDIHYEKFFKYDQKIIKNEGVEHLNSDVKMCLKYLNLKNYEKLEYIILRKLRINFFSEIDGCIFLGNDFENEKI